MKHLPRLLPVGFWPAGMMLLLGGCAGAVASGPEFQPAVAGATFLSSYATDQETKEDWWTEFSDAQLVRFVDLALDNNNSLDAASANLQAAQAIASAARLALSPSTSSRADAELTRAPQDGATVDVSVSAGVGASWEFDAFGRIRAQISAATFDVEAARQVRRDIAVMIASETALAYIDLRGAQRRLDVAHQNAEAQSEGLDLLRTLLENGRATRLDLERAEAQYRTTRASQPRLQAAAETAVSRLAVLIGVSASQPGDELSMLLTESADIPELVGPPITGTPEKLLRRRPDIRQAEAVVGQRLALGDAARAQLFPTIVFNADLLALFSDSSNIISGDRFGFALGPSIQWAGPDLRRVRAGIAANDALSQAAISNYEQTVLTALGEVEIALTNYGRELERRTDLVQAARSARTAWELAGLRFEEGLDDYLDVLDAQRTLLVAEDQLAESQLQAARLAVILYRALGGMWSDNTFVEHEQEMLLE